MSRYTGPVFKKSRRFGYSILETNKEFSKGRKRTYAPGQHGNKRVKLSDYGLHLYEKQKVKLVFGVSEKQLLKTYKKAVKSKEITGTVLLQLLESRLDNLVYRAGFATTRRQARQLVNHGHFTIDGKKANIPSMQIKTGTTVALKETSRKLKLVQEALEMQPASAWVTRKDFQFTFDRVPERTEMHKDIKEALVVEFYAK
ncbi:30S ribosomal protein S4 [Mycoplasmopsis synoviae]|uniref:Small ribosomal subunit protein uS4 n=1 Tax=Mycoplasmopsis synoviae TaxID=2109 RepID=A0AAX3F066_MYCSY|nr:30S ribosomal protein S4 [Mycoplasmopsis synoviae]QGL45505.1 30S ribosomal protein S4 [Mycoplasmopsis synoviae]QXV99283.1 30S ribosomal protein S4 [Mycoplasmopsis synoviae]UBM43465.1 30S ribosomal protein S4 [Mycoplasmopsis synoviae]ULL02236.1 30S ribosomal protein S4 [Mycoplasmopsis synoviae]UZW63579.1 30S ribosomal protein S4 [Mycoplasmopsis synoviae]